MSEKYFRGKITFINNDKQRATIEYVAQNKIKTIQAVIDDKQQEKYVQLKLIKKPHRFLVGDNVKFVIKKSSANIFFADHVLYEFNNSLEVLIDKARITNKFLGYVKFVDEKYFIKEIDSYLFFPLKLYRFEIKPETSDSEKPVSFKLLNIDKPDKIVAELYNHNYVTGYKTAIKQYKNEETIDAIVKKISPYGVFVVLSDSQLEAKLTIDENISNKINNQEIFLEKTMQVKIKHLTGDRIVIEAP
jgi:ribosomal protein S1